MKIGDVNHLLVSRTSTIGLFLKNEENEEVLLPKRYVNPDLKPGDPIEVFIYNDSEDRLIATTEVPLAKVHQFAFLTVKEVLEMGAFLDWGLPKDLLLPKKEMSWEPRVGEGVLVYVYLDRLTKRLAASMKLDKFVSKQPENLNFGEKVEVIVWKEHPLGLQVLIDEEYLGMLYKNQIYKALFPGDKTSAYVNQIRDDGRVDLLLQAPGYEVVDEATKTVLLKLQQAENGVLPYSDKTASDIIQREFNMSKKTFKKVIGGLYRRNLIDLKPTMILLTEAGRQANL